VAIQGDVTGGVSEVTLANNWMGYGSEANTASCVDIDFSYTYEITDQGLATIKLIGNRFYIGGQNLTTPNDVTVVNVHSAYNGACTDSNPCVGSALIENSMFDNTLAVNFTLTNPIIKCTGFNKCLVMGNRINDKYDPTGNNPGTFFAADTDSGHIVTNNMAPWWGITYPANVAVSAFGNNTAITDPVPISSTTSLQATSYIEPTGTMFHLTGGGTALHALNYVNNGRDSTTAFYQFTAICDNGLTWNTGGSLGFAANGSVGAGGMVTFTWDPGTSLW
jgi:hypothetical protein